MPPGPWKAPEPTNPNIPSSSLRAQRSNLRVKVRLLRRLRLLAMTKSEYLHRKTSSNAIRVSHLYLKCLLLLKKQGHPSERHSGQSPLFKMPTFIKKTGTPNRLTLSFWPSTKRDSLKLLLRLFWRLELSLATQLAKLFSSLVGISLKDILRMCRSAVIHSHI